MLTQRPTNAKRGSEAAETFGLIKAETEMCSQVPIVEAAPWRVLQRWSLEDQGHIRLCRNPSPRTAVAQLTVGPDETWRTQPQESTFSRYVETKCDGEVFAIELSKSNQVEVQAPSGASPASAITETNPVSEVDRVCVMIQEHGHTDPSRQVKMD